MRKVHPCMSFLPRIYLLRYYKDKFCPVHFSDIQKHFTVNSHYRRILKVSDRQAINFGLCQTIFMTLVSYRSFQIQIQRETESAKRAAIQRLISRWYLSFSPNDGRERRAKESREKIPIADANLKHRSKLRCATSAILAGNRRAFCLGPPIRPRLDARYPT